jgi:hypothetical protein
MARDDNGRKRGKAVVGHESGAATFGRETTYSPAVYPLSQRRVLPQS